MIIRFLRLAAWGACCVCLMNGAKGAEPSVHLTQGELQRLVYGSHLGVVITERPEFEAAVYALLELDRRNPGADPGMLVDLVGFALQQYRESHSEADYRMRTRDEVFASFFAHLVLAPGYAALKPATLSLLQHLIEDSYSGTAESMATQLHAWNQRSLAMERAPRKRQAVLDAVLERALVQPGFAACLDGLVVPETGVFLHHSPAKVMAWVPALSQNPTVQWLVTLHGSAGPAGVDVSTAQLEALFAGEMAILRDTIAENQALHSWIESSHNDLPGYLLDAAQVAAMEQQHQLAQEGHALRIAASSAAAHSLASITSKTLPEVSGFMAAVADSTGMLADGFRMWNSALKLSRLAACTNFVTAGLTLVNLYMEATDAGTSPDSNEMILEEINTLKDLILDLADHIDYRFDRVDALLLDVLDKLDDSIRILGEISTDLLQVRRELISIQTGLSRLERQLFNYLYAGFSQDLQIRLNNDLQYEARTQEPMAWSLYRDEAENTFYSCAVTFSKDALRSHTPASNYTYPMTDLLAELEARPLEHNLNYIRGFLEQRLGVPALPVPVGATLANPRVWFIAADAYLKIAVENPMNFRRIARSRLDEIIRTGDDLEKFLGAIALLGGSSASANRPLFEAVLQHYDEKLQEFETAVAEEEIRYGDTVSFTPELWRDWEARTAPAQVAETAVDGRYKLIRLPGNVTRIAAGGYHFLALRADGTVFAWGNNEMGQCDVPEDLTDVIEIVAGTWNSLALCADGTVVEWPAPQPEYAVPADLGDVVAIAVGYNHNLALKSDGTVVAWGFNHEGQSNVPEGLTDVVSIAVGGHYWGSHSLALKEDGSVVAWGSNNYGQCNVPQALADGLEDVAAITACGLMSAAVLSDGTLIGWPVDLTASGPVAQLALGYRDTDDAQRRGRAVALTRQGSAEMLWGQADAGAGMPLSSDIVQVAAASGEWHGMLALHADGTLTAWGAAAAYANTFRSNHDAAIEPVVVAIASTDMQLVMLDDGGSVRVEGMYQQAPVPEDLPPAVAVATGAGHNEYFCLALLEDGTVRGWGGNSRGQVNIPAGLNNVVAIAAGGTSGINAGGHALALRKDGSVVAWGDNTIGQAAVPADLPEAVAVSAGQRHSIALLGDGTVHVWGDDRFGIQTPPDVNDIVAVSAGMLHSLGLRANGTVVAWGYNSDGQCNVPAGLDDVISVVAGEYRSLALRADGTVVAWGYVQMGRVDTDSGRTGVLMMSAGSSAWNNYLVAPQTAAVDGDGPYAVTHPSRVSAAVTAPFKFLCGELAGQLDLNLHAAAQALTGAKLLIESVVSLGLPLSLELDDAFRGFLVGSEPIPDSQVLSGLYLSEAARLDDPASLWSRPRDLSAILQARRDAFRSRLEQRLDLVDATGQPEIPRMVGHTLTLLKVLRSAHNNQLTPAPVLEFMAPQGAAALTLYGEPWIRYPVDSSQGLSTWTATGQTLRDGAQLSFQMPAAPGALFYRARVP